MTRPRESYRPAPDFRRLEPSAEDTDGLRTLLGSRTIFGGNASSQYPFGAIDTPAPGATISGSNYLNWGWALTQQPRLFPLDGSTITVYIDGVPVGPLREYNLFRGDIAALFPGLKNSLGAVGYRAIDTTTLSEGMHTISWVALDDGFVAGSTVCCGAGLGSRYFHVRNSAWTAAALTSGELRQVQPAGAHTAIPAKVAGLDLERHSASIRALPLLSGLTREFQVAPLDRITLDLRPQQAWCDATYEGYLEAGGELRDLPVGASLDRAGQFYWQPGPGFIGSYPFVFVRTACDGTRQRAPVAIISARSVRPGEPT